MAWTIAGATPSSGEQDSQSIWDTSSPLNTMEKDVLGQYLGIIEFANATSSVVYTNFVCKQYGASLSAYSMSSGQVYPSGAVTSSLFVGNSASNNYLSGSIIYLFGLV